jgi:hypothetical protein
MRNVPTIDELAGPWSDETAKVHIARGRRGGRLAARVQPAVPVIGFPSGRPPGEPAHLLAGFHQGLREDGYVEDKNFADRIPMVGVGSRSDHPIIRLSFLVTGHAQSGNSTRDAVAAMPSREHGASSRQAEQFSGLPRELPSARRVGRPSPAVPPANAPRIGTNDRQG